MRAKQLVFVLAVLLVAACARTSVMPLSRNAIQVTVDAPPVCGTTGAQKVAMQMAAAETINRGFERFLIGGATQTSETVVAGGTTTTGSATVVGNRVYGQTYTSGPVLMRRRGQIINVLLLNPGEPGFDNGIDAKATLGPDWQSKLDTDSRIACTG